MADFEKGNQLWKLRSKHGRDSLFKTPELLWESACEYFDWCNNNPIESSKKTLSTNGSSDEVKEFQRPFTKQGLFLYFHCSETWLTNFKKTCSEDFLRVIEAIEQTIESQQIEHAMVGMFNSNLVARIQGIKDSTDVTTNGKEMNTIINLGNGTKPNEVTD
jgi:hypothetical protein